MGFIEITEEMMNKAFTENGGVANNTTGSYCLDYFSLIGGMRFNPNNAINLFLKAFTENPLIATKILFYVRDVRNGLGERNLFKLTFSLLCSMYPETCKELINYIPTLGRWDDLLSCYDTPIRKDVVKLIKKQLDEDINNKKAGKPISLLAKWMPSINTSSLETRDYALRLCDSLGMKKEDYRKLLSFLRKDLIIENNLRTQDYTFDYSKVPGNALLKYQKTFINKDSNRYNEYLIDVKNNKAKMNTSVVYPYQVIRKFDEDIMYGRPLSDEEINSLNTVWDNFNHEEVAGKTIVVRDGSYSMYDGQSPTAQSVATSLTMLFAERLTGEFKNKFITFSKNPALVTIPEGNAYYQYANIVKYHEASNTDIRKVYDLILSVYSNPKFNKEDALDRIVIISDMEFDDMVDYDDTAYNYFKEKFEELGFEIPEVVFWNVRCRNIQFPATNDDKKIKLVSGASPIVIDSIMKNDGTTAYDYMLECLKQYDYLDDIKF